MRGAFCGGAFDCDPFFFSWVCLLTSPAVVNCIKAVSGSMAICYNGYCNRERISKAHRVQAGEHKWDKTNKKLNGKEEEEGWGSLVL